MDSRDKIFVLCLIVGFIVISWEVIWKRFFGEDSNVINLRHFGPVDRNANPFLFWLVWLVGFIAWILAGLALYLILRFYFKI